MEKLIYYVDGTAITYYKNLFNPDGCLESLLGLDWIRIGNTPRSEYFCSDIGESYTYGTGRGIRTYEPQPWTKDLKELQAISEELVGAKQEVLFMNRYDSQKDQLGWHADDSPEMNDDIPITIITFGAERDIMFRSNKNPNDVFKLKLQHGSVLIMPAGFQDTHMHRIPKSDREDISTRISLTFRGYKSNE